MRGFDNQIIVHAVRTQYGIGADTTTVVVLNVAEAVSLLSSWIQAPGMIL